MLKGFHSATSAALSCSCPARIIAPDTAKRAKRFTRAFSPKMNFRRTPEFTSVTWDRTFCCAPSPIAYRGAKTVVASPKVRKAPGSFSQSVRVGDWLLLAGQDAVGFNREVEAEGDLAGQTEVTLQHTKDILEEAGGTLDDIVKTTVYLIAGQDRSRFAAAYTKFFNRYSRSSKMPAGLTVEVRELSPRCLVEIDAVAYLG